MTEFDDHKYTADSIIKQLSLMELHGKDGSAVEAGCHCIEGKHLYAVEGLSEEGVGFATSAKEKDFYAQLSTLSRSLRRGIENEWFSMQDVLHDAGLNPGPRAFLPHGLTETEKHSVKLQHKLSSCIQKAEIRCCGKETKDYSGCSCNPVAVCRAQVQHPS